MKITADGTTVRLSSDAFAKTTRGGKTIINAYEISTKRRKMPSGEWKDDEYSQPLRISIVFIGEAADTVAAANALAKGSVIKIIEGSVSNPKREKIDLEIAVFKAEVVEVGTQTSNRPQRPATNRGVRPASQSVDETFNSLGSSEDLGF